MRVEILHVRDPDSECGLSVWIDGAPVEFALEDIDPGRGHIRSEWDRQQVHSKIGAPDVQAIQK